MSLLFIMYLHNSLIREFSISFQFLLYPFQSTGAYCLCTLINQHLANRTIFLEYTVVLLLPPVQEPLLSKYISEDCVQRTGEKEIFIGINGMKQHLVALKKTYPDYTMKIIRQYVTDNYVICYSHLCKSLYALSGCNRLFVCYMCEKIRYN